MSYDRPSITACTHTRKQYTIDGEVVCVSCGSVLGCNDYCDQPKVTGITLPNSTHFPNNNLYVTKELGSKECKDRKQSDLSKFSNVCTKLRLPHHVSEEAWKLYRKIIESPVEGRITQAEFAAYSVYAITRKHGLAILEEEITDAVMMSFCVKKIRKIARIALMIRTCANINVPYEIVVVQENKNYHISTSIRRRINNPALFGMSKEEALTIYGLSKGRDNGENPELKVRTKARQSIKLAAALLGLEEVLGAT